MNDEQRKQIISIVVSAVIGIVVGVAGVFGINVLSGCASTGSANWDVQVSPLEVENGWI